LRPFREYVRRFHYDTLTFWPESPKYLIDVVGSDRVVLGTDIYYGMDEEHRIEFVNQVKLAAADRDALSAATQPGCCGSETAGPASCDHLPRRRSHSE